MFSNHGWLNIMEGCEAGDGDEYHDVRWKSLQPTVSPGDLCRLIVVAGVLTS